MKTENKWRGVVHGALLTSSAVLMGIAAVYLFVPHTSDIDPQTTATVSETALRGVGKDNLPETLETPIIPDQTIALFKTALSSMDRGDIDAVRSALANLKPENTEHQYLTWLLATSGNKAVTEEEIRDAQKRLSDWPNQTAMQHNLEKSMSQNGLSAMRLRLALGDAAPQSFFVAFQLARTYLLTGDNQKIRQLLTPYWHDGVLTASDETLVLENFGTVLTKHDHEIRYFNMMSRDRVKSASRLVETLANAEIHAAWSAVIRRQKSAGDKMDALSDADKKRIEYAFMRTEYLRYSGKDDDAIKILNALPKTVDALINPDAWWDERRIISRHKFEAGDIQMAYDVVAEQIGGDDETQIDAAFHAGWYALRGLNNPAKAAPYFEKITKIAKGNISLARGYYWLGRSLDGDAAKQAFEKAATFPTTFYGQLASAAIDRPLASSGIPVAMQNIGNLSVIKAIDRLTNADEISRARALYLSLGWQMDEPSKIRAVVDHASHSGDYYAALKIAKAADWRGIDVGGLTHPIGAISDATSLSPDDHALAYAVARQESEFNIAAVSRANAKGILQLLPGTAKEMARQQNIAYAPEKLTTDANYNARLGTAYLNQQLDRFDGSYVLTFAAYNAGPARAKEWIERFGDPRGKSLEDIIDWVEQIPFPETRSYVQRILENLQVYKLQLGQQASLVDDLRKGHQTQ